MLNDHGPMLSVAQAAALLAARAHGVLMELEAALAEVPAGDPDHAFLARATEGAEECYLSLLDLAAAHEQPSDAPALSMALISRCQAARPN